MKFGNEGNEGKLGNEGLEFRGEQGAFPNEIWERGKAEVLADFPTVPPDGLRAVIAFAAASASDDLPVPPLPALA